MRKAVLAGVKDANDAEWLEMLATLSGANAIKGGGGWLQSTWLGRVRRQCSPHSCHGGELVPSLCDP